jgi:all-trans-retinol 13,14-reductase
LLALCEAAPFARWMALPPGGRPEDYLAFRAWVEHKLLAQFARHFPALAPMVRWHELSTPLTQRHFVRSPLGAMYGIVMDGERVTSESLNIRSTVPGLQLAGQDAAVAGVQAAAMSGLLAAAAIEPTLLRQLAA